MKENNSKTIAFKQREEHHISKYKFKANEYGKIDFKVDKFGIVHTSIGKVNFEAEKIMDNAREFMATIQKLKPSSAKGTYVKSVFLSSTMSPGIKLDLKSLLD